MINVAYAILLLGLISLPIPLWYVADLRARKRQSREGAARLQEAADRYHLELTEQNEGRNGWLAADSRQQKLLLVTEWEEGWRTRLIDLKAGCSCQVQRSMPPGQRHHAPSASVSLRIEPPGEQPAEWQLYQSQSWHPRKYQEAEKIAEQWCSRIRQTPVPL